MYKYKYDEILCKKSKCKIQTQFQIFKDDTYIFSNNIFYFHSVCICIDINLSKLVADNLLQCEKIKEMMFIETD